VQATHVKMEQRAWTNGTDSDANVCLDTPDHHVEEVRELLKFHSGQFEVEGNRNK